MVILKHKINLEIDSQYQYCFQTKLWTMMFPSIETHILKLTITQRQKNPEFIQLLSHARYGKRYLLEEDRQVLFSRCVSSESLVDKTITTFIYPTNAKVNTHNKDMLELLSGQSTIYYQEFCAKTFHEINRDSDDPFMSRFIEDDHIDTLLNINEYRSEYGYHLLEIGGSKEINELYKLYHSYTQLPFRLELKVGAYIMLLQNGILQGCVNGSRGIITSIRNNPKYNINQLGIHFFNSTTQFPIQLDTIATTDTLDLNQHECTIEIGHSHTRVLYMKMCPLNLAWAFTVHKSQGLTLNNICLDLVSFDKSRPYGYFAEGQAYTAISRISNPQTLYLLNADTRVFKTNYNVIQSNLL